MRISCAHFFDFMVERDKSACIVMAVRCITEVARLDICLGSKEIYWRFGERGWNKQHLVFNIQSYVVSVQRGRRISR